MNSKVKFHILPMAYCLPEQQLGRKHSAMETSHVAHVASHGAGDYLHKIMPIVVSKVVSYAPDKGVLRKQSG